MGAKHISEYLQIPDGHLDQVTAGSESSYRRGFIHGYDQGMDHMLLLIQEGYKPEQAYELLLEFFNEELQGWRSRNRGEFVTPPDFENWRSTYVRKTNPHQDEIDEYNRQMRENSRDE